VPILLLGAMRPVSGSDLSRCRPRLVLSVSDLNLLGCRSRPRRCPRRFTAVPSHDSPPSLTRCCRTRRPHCCVLSLGQPTVEVAQATCATLRPSAIAVQSHGDTPVAAFRRADPRPGETGPHYVPTDQRVDSKADFNDGHGTPARR
jgi:hypothetical protein